MVEVSQVGEQSCARQDEGGDSGSSRRTLGMAAAALLLKHLEEIPPLWERRMQGR